MRQGSACAYCGAPATAWHGDIAWCDDPRCGVMHDWATHEPRLLLPPVRPHLWHMAVCHLVHVAWRVVVALVPAVWLLAPARSWKARAAIAAYGGEWFLWNRARGLI